MRRSLVGSWRPVNRAAFALAFVLIAATPGPNAIVSGARPAPYGFFIPCDLFATLLRHHSLPVRLEYSQTARELFLIVPVGSRQLALRDYNRRFGIELPADPDAPLPVGVDIWIPPEQEVAGSCCLWLHSRCDGWVTARSDVNGAFVDPTCSHAAADSGSIDILLLPVPIQLQREWIQFAGNAASLPADAKSVQEMRPELRDLLRRKQLVPVDSIHRFSFSQWVGETSKVARVMIELPIADLDGELRFAEPPTVRWLDAYGKDTPQWVAPAGSALFLVLVSAAGGAVLAYLLFAARRRVAAARA